MEHITSKELKRFNYLSSEIDQVYHTACQRLGMADSAMIVLYTICDHGGSCGIWEICRESGISKQTINSALRKLENENKIYLESVGGKNKKVCLTKEGEQLAEQTALKLIQAENEVFASWSEEELGIYLNLTEKFLNEMKEKIKTLERKEP